MEDKNYEKDHESLVVPFVLQFKKEIDGTLEDLEKGLMTGNPEILERNINFVRINTAEFLVNMETTIEFDEFDQEAVVHLRGLEITHSFAIADIKSVWYRRPMPVEVPEEITIESHKNFVQEETNAVIDGLWLLTKNCLWVSNPWAIRRASNKIFQLNIARSLGFVVPRSIITTSPLRAKDFYTRYKGNIVTKVLTRGTFEENSRTSIILTNKVLAEDLKNLDTVRFCPTLFQEYIPKKTEFRVTVIGEKVFACEIHSQESEITKVDWRNYGPEIPYIPSQQVRMAPNQSMR